MRCIQIHTILTEVENTWDMEMYRFIFDTI